MLQVLTQIFINATNSREKKKKRVCHVSNFIHTGNGMQAFSLFPLHRQKVRDTREVARKSLHAQIFIATTFWVDFSSSLVFATPMRQDFPVGKGSREALKLPEDMVMFSD